MGVSRNPWMKTRSGIRWRSPWRGFWAQLVTRHVEPKHRSAGARWLVHEATQVLRRSDPSRWLSRWLRWLWRYRSVDSMGVGWGANPCSWGRLWRTHEAHPGKGRTRRAPLSTRRGEGILVCP